MYKFLLGRSTTCFVLLLAGRAHVGLGDNGVLLPFSSSTTVLPSRNCEQRATDISGLDTGACLRAPPRMLEGTSAG